MKKIILGVVGVVAVAAIGFVAAVSMQPAVTNIERSTVIKASAADVYPMLNDYKAFVTWSPWSELDPNSKVEFSDPASGQGAWYTWDGNDDVGSGKMTTTSVVENKSLEQSLEFYTPFEATAKVGYKLAPEGEGTKVVWWYTSENNFGAKAAGLFMDMDEMLGADFQKGLDKLKPMAEKAAGERLAAEKLAEEEAAKAAAEAAAAEGGDEAAGDGAAAGG